MSDQLVAETFTWQHTILETDIHAPGGIRTNNPSRRASANLRLRPRSHWDRQKLFLDRKKKTCGALQFSAPLSVPHYAHGDWTKERSAQEAKFYYRQKQIFFSLCPVGCNLQFSFLIVVGGNLFPRLQSLGRKAGHPHPSSGAVMNAWFSTSKPVSLLGLVFLPAQTTLISPAIYT